jgi:hypothetical protein
MSRRLSARSRPVDPQSADDARIEAVVDAWLAAMLGPSAELAGGVAPQERPKPKPESESQETTS